MASGSLTLAIFACEGEGEEEDEEEDGGCRGEKDEAEDDGSGGVWGGGGTEDDSPPALALPVAASCWSHTTRTLLVLPTANTAPITTSTRSLVDTDSAIFDIIYRITNLLLSYV